MNIEIKWKKDKKSDMKGAAAVGSFRHKHMHCDLVVVVVGMKLTMEMMTKRMRKMVLHVVVRLMIMINTDGGIMTWQDNIG